MTNFIYEEFAKNYLKDLLSPYVEVELGRKVAPRLKERKEDSHSQFGKSLFSALLSPYGTVEIDKKLPPPEDVEVPVYITVGNTEITDELGLLKKLLNKNAVFYPLFDEVEDFDIEDCLHTTLTLFQEYSARKERYTQEFDNFLNSHGDYLDDFKEDYEEEYQDTSYQDARDTWVRETFYPNSWVLLPTADESLLEAFGADPSEDWVKGVYFLAPAFGMQFIVIDELPKTYETLWLRLLTKGEVLLQAIDELEALPQSNHLRFKALNLLMGLYTNLQVSEDLDAEDQELVARLSRIYRQEMN